VHGFIVQFLRNRKTFFPAEKPGSIQSEQGDYASPPPKWEISCTPTSGPLFWRDIHGYKCSPALGKFCHCFMREGKSASDTGFFFFNFVI
jgi:hypothetical protein